jgi:hypothetical protein
VPQWSQPIATRVDGSLYYVHQDHPSTSSGHSLGSTMAVSDAAGQAVGCVQYDPYGEVLTNTLPLPLPQSVLQYHGTSEPMR